MPVKLPSLGPQREKKRRGEKEKRKEKKKKEREKEKKEEKVQKLFLMKKTEKENFEF